VTLSIIVLSQQILGHLGDPASKGLGRKSRAYLHGDTTLPSKISDAPGKADVALVTPEVTPGVLHNPVVTAILRAIAHHKHSVVQSSSAGRVKHSASVQLELTLVSLNGNTDGLVGSSLHRR